MRSFASITLVLVGVFVFGQTQKQPQYILRSVYFGGGSHYVDSLQRMALYQFLDSIPNRTFYQISIHSHTDNIGGAAYNAWLSQMRSESVIAELLFKEIDPNSISIRDFGQFNPVFDNSTPVGRARNRRVDIIFWPLVF